MLGNDRVFWRSPPWDSFVYWSLDLETGGLDPRKDAILAVGMVPVRDSAVRLGEAYSTLVRPDHGDEFHAQSIQAHQLVPGEVASAPSLPSVLVDIDRRIREGALLVHQAALDVAFLKRAYARAGLRWPDPPVVDTVTLLIKAARRARFVDPDAPNQVPDLNLLAARRNLGLPDYGQHDALTDAVATAELFLVLRRQLGARTLRDVS
jgi:DNA polymerase-3 subunit epsilon